MLTTRNNPVSVSMRALLSQHSLVPLKTHVSMYLLSQLLKTVKFKFVAQKRGKVCNKHVYVCIYVCVSVCD